ncbi:hypothetical protein PNEG_00606 [Pneumocystis murina B123]|uniref:Pre-mRNA-splicing factor RSE1 n=1 Tax=Pneumocystis murina (strain B123) TaxID=1069680 RepID=M7PAV3_PNEMU|nr:hypothetical protein PNEG_00606 [Pneumocystis murina B123]EMR11005.1 hypothetical protein PNEG_00606 [Pneumocystis murina B123]
MAAITPNMFLYSLSLLPPSAISITVVGQFSGQKQQEIVVARGSRLELLKPDPNLGKIKTLLSHDVYGIIRSLIGFRLAGTNKDHLIVGSDSGRITILEYKPDTNVFSKVHQETYGKSGVRRVVPGQYLAVDPKGRATMIASIEKNKLVYVLNRDSATNLTISSPLEAHKSCSLVFCLVGLDVGYENPVFAALEVDYTEAELDPSGKAYRDTQKVLTYYELDLGLNHVVRKWTDPVDRKANLLIAVPGGTDGPSGTLVCTENSIFYKHKGKKVHRIPIPTRMGPLAHPKAKQIIVSYVVHKMRGAFFFLLQNEDGDLFKVTIDLNDNEVKSLRIKYFDTVPVSTGLSILKSGFLFVGSEYGNHHLYQFEKLGDDNNEIEFSSVNFPVLDLNETYEPSYFRPRPLENLLLVDDMNSMNPLMDSKILNLTDEDAPQIYALCGRGARSTFRILRHGLEVNEIVASGLPGSPTAVWTTKLVSTDQYDAYIVLSFVNGTLVLSIGETVEEISDTGFLSSSPTLAVQQLGDDALIQVHPKGIRHIQADKRVNEWKTPPHRSIVQATTNQRQVVIALSNGEIVYFELDDEGNLNEYQDKKQMTGSITSLSIGQVQEGRQRHPFLAVGCDDSTVRIISLEPDNTLENLSVQALTAPPNSLCIMSTKERNIETFYLHIGLNNGVYLRSVLETSTGQLKDTRTRFLGSRPVKLFCVMIQNQLSVIALSSRPWLAYIINASLHLVPLIYESLEYCWGFSSEQCPEGIVGIQGQDLRIFTIEGLDNVLKQDCIPLTYTPRRFIKHPNEHIFYIIESDHNVLPLNERQKRIEGLQNGDSFVLLPEDFGLPRASTGNWASCITVLDPLARKVLSKIEFDDNEAAFSIATVAFKNQNDEIFLVIGTGKNVILSPKSFSSAYINIYRFVDEGKSIELVHKTEVDNIPLALLGFQGRLLAGLGKMLRIYEMGMKKCLRKCEVRAVPNCIVQLHTQGSRIIIADIQESIHFAVYKYLENRLIVFADDIIPRWTTSFTMLDYDTVAAGDKFGNFWINRCPPEVSESADEDPSGAQLIHEKSYLFGAAKRLKMLAHFYIGDMFTSMHKVQLIAGGRDIIVYTGMMGSIGIFLPFVGREDVDFFQQLEALMRTEDPSLIGRDHLIYRGYYVPVKSVIDGDLCERFLMLPYDKKQMIANELDREVSEIAKKIEDMRVRVAF